MALSEKIEYDKIEVVGNYKFVQVRKCTIVIKDGVEIARSFSRFLLDAGTLDESDNFVDNPLISLSDGSVMPDEVKAICNAVWTTSVKDAWKSKLIADKPSS
tara:strand:- start:1031 stop:1336 length:306 start_codon:yes stop_codon:yes gene_type:complete